MACLLRNRWGHTQRLALSTEYLPMDLSAVTPWAVRTVSRALVKPLPHRGASPQLAYGTSFYCRGVQLSLGVQLSRPQVPLEEDFVFYAQEKYYHPSHNNEKQKTP